MSAQSAHGMNGSGHTNSHVNDNGHDRKNVFSNGPVFGEWSHGADALAQQWTTDPRWKDVVRSYSAEDVVKLRGSVPISHTLAKRGAERLWYLINHEPYVAALGALTGNQAVQQVAADLKAIYLSGWQVAADANNALHTYPDQSLYPADSVPNVVKRINNALQRADQIDWAQGKREVILTRATSAS